MEDDLLATSEMNREADFKVCISIMMLNRKTDVFLLFVRLFICRFCSEQLNYCKINCVMTKLHAETCMTEWLVSDSQTMQDLLTTEMSTS
jgi:hypothetical protein